MKLIDLARKYGTDKTVYAPFYDILLQPHRVEIKRVLEIGIGTVQTMQHVENYVPGASLRMWRDYFPNAQIIGIDIDSEAVEQARGERIETLITDGANAIQLENLAKSVGEFDLIVDDGSHNPRHQAIAAKALSPYLSANGFYIIEDCWDAYTVSASLPFGHSVIETFYGDQKGRLSQMGRLILFQGKSNG